MISFATYNKITLSLLGLLVGSFIGLAMYMQPHIGELTRMGGYLENDFGWNFPQEQFAAPLFVRAASLDEYDRYYDVVVLGDSFSDDLLRGWQNYLVSNTGWSIISFNMNNITLDNLLEATAYRNTPPKLLIYETIERNVISRHSRCAGDKSFSKKEPSKAHLSINKVNVSVRSAGRRTFAPSWINIDFSGAVNYWRKLIARTILRRNITEVHQFHLNKSALFSNREDSRLLVITRAFKLRGVSGQKIETAQCRLLEIQNEVQSNGQTAFLTLIFPDKLSVYADYIDDVKYTSLSVASVFEGTAGLNVVKLKSSFDDAVSEGVVDLYLPNDTHCGFYGYRLAAGAVLEFMQGESWIESEGRVN